MLGFFQILKLCMIEFGARCLEISGYLAEIIPSRLKEKVWILNFKKFGYFKIWKIEILNQNAATFRVKIAILLKSLVFYSKIPLILVYANLIF